MNGISLRALYSEVLSSIEDDVHAKAAVGPDFLQDASWRDEFPTKAFHRAEQLLQERHVCEISPNTDLIDMVQTACRQLREPKATSLAARWFDAETPSGGDVELDTAIISMDPVWIAGVAASAAVLVVVWTLRKGRSIRLPRLNQEPKPSPDFVAIHTLTKDQGDVADVARELVETANEPWSWKLYDALSSLDSLSKSRLLARLVERGLCEVSTIKPVNGCRFDPATMSVQPGPTSEDVWIVHRVKSWGYRIDDCVVQAAEVSTSTIDAWILLDTHCAIGRFLDERQNADSLLPGGYDGRFRWRAAWGIIYPEDLRDQFDEKSLNTWRCRMINELNCAYEGDPERQLVVTAHTGDVFEPSTMEARGEVLRGDAVVETVLERDEFPQHGLACPGGSPLLLAIVKAKAAIDT